MKYFAFRNTENLNLICTATQGVWLETTDTRQGIYVTIGYIAANQTAFSYDATEEICYHDLTRIKNKFLKKKDLI